MTSHRLLSACTAVVLGALTSGGCSGHKTGSNPADAMATPDGSGWDAGRSPDGSNSEPDGFGQNRLDLAGPTESVVADAKPATDASTENVAADGPPAVDNRSDSSRLPQALDGAPDTRSVVDTATGSVAVDGLPAIDNRMDSKRPLESPDGAPDARSPVDATTGNDSGAPSCEWGVYNEGTLNVALLDTAGRRVPCADVACEFIFTVSDHRLDVPTTATDGWYFSLLGTGKVNSQSIARMEFYIVRGWDVTWQSGQKLTVRDLNRVIDCPSLGSDQEYPVQTHVTLRDEKGALLLLSAPDVPLAPGGQALLDPSFAPEVTLSWIDLGCSAYQGTGVGTAGGGRRTVGVVARDPKTGTEAMATWGRNASISIGGVSYVLSVNQGWVFADALGCGRAALALYKQGYFVDI